MNRRIRVTLAATLASGLGTACVGSEPPVVEHDAGMAADASGFDSPIAPQEAGGVDAGSDVLADGGGCAAGAQQCNANAPQTCIGGTWQNQAPCGGSTPVCSNGICGAYRATGGLRSTAPAPGAGSIRLVAGGFEIGGRACDAQGVCVTGGIVP
jgi:hypothetical protein